MLKIKSKKTKGVFEIMEMMSLKCNHLGGGYFNCMVENGKVLAVQLSDGKWYYLYDSKKILEDKRGLSIPRFQRNKKYLGIWYSEKWALRQDDRDFEKPLYVNEHGYCSFKKPFLMK
jgi:hypothetical protein